MRRAPSSPNRRSQPAGSSGDGPPSRKPLQQTSIAALLRAPPRQSTQSPPADDSAEEGIIWSFCDPRGRAAGSARPLADPSQAGPRKKAKQVDTLVSLMKRGKQRRQQRTEGVESAPPSNASAVSALKNCWMPRASLAKDRTCASVAASHGAAEQPAENHSIDALLESLLEGGSRKNDPPASPTAVSPIPPFPCLPPKTSSPKPTLPRAPPTAHSSARLHVCGSGAAPLHAAAPTPALAEAKAAGCLSPPLPRLSAPPSSPHAELRRPHRPAMTSGLVLAISPLAAEGALLLELLPDDGGGRLHVKLCDEWSRTPVRVADRINLVGDLGGCGCAGRAHARCAAVRRDGGPLLVLRPEAVLTGTALAKACGCTRSAVLSRSRKDHEMSEQLTLGTIKHRLFEHVLAAWEQPSPPASWEALVAEAVNEHLPELLALQMDEKAVYQQVRQALGVLRSWAASCLPTRTAAGRPFAIDKQMGELLNDGHAAAVPTRLSIRKILATEQDVCSLTYGLKGKVDATLLVEASGADGRVTHCLPMPLELKTGKRNGYNINEHNAQVMVYTLLLSELHETRIPGGLLFYPQLAGTAERGVFVAVAEAAPLASLMMLRNEMVGGAALHSHVDRRMPAVLQSRSACSRCSELQHCALVHATLEGGDAASFGVTEAFTGQLAHLEESHLRYFRRWHHMLALEESVAERTSRELFTMKARERQAVGRALAQLALRHVDAAGPRRFAHTFARPAGGASLLEAALCVGELATVSVEPSAGGGARWAVARGPIGALCEGSVTVLLDVRLDELGVGAELPIRIDRAEMAVGFAQCRANLLRLLGGERGGERGGGEAEGAVEAEAPRRASRLLRLVVDLAAPRFAPADAAACGGLNDEQAHAVERIVSARDYALVQGMPGTGKTTLIAHAARTLAARGQTVLLCAYTHSALDHVLLKLQQMGVPFLRLGALTKVHAELHAHTLAALTAACGGAAELHAQVLSRRVVATTSLSLAQPPLYKRRFDVCIVDEAGQMTEAVCLGPLLLAERFALVGDHYQLPPLVAAEEAREQGMDTSLFRRLTEAHPRAVCRLRQQYRMCADIMALSNELVYGGQLRCGSDGVASAQLAVRCLDRRAAPWLHAATQPEHRVLFFDTDGMPAVETRSSAGNVSNPVEAELCAQLVAAFVAAGVPAAQVAVLAPYKAQLKAIGALLPAEAAAVPLLTIDKCQGQDFDCCVLSLVRSNERADVGRLLADWRRLNVAFTRARTKMVLVGSASTLKHSQLLACLLQLLERRRWIWALPPNALQFHGTSAVSPHQCGPLDTERSAPSCDSRSVHTHALTVAADAGDPKGEGCRPSANIVLQASSHSVPTTSGRCGQLDGLLDW